MMPTFLLIGAMKAGTTALYQACDQHPEIYMSPIKEPNFFAFAEEPPSFKAPLDREEGGINDKTISDPTVYKRLFDGAEPGQARGEASHTTLYWPQSPANIQTYAPNAKLIAVLRNPVERAYSEYLHFVRDGYESLEQFEDALDAESDRIAAQWAFGRYVDRGRYYEQLRRFYDQFDPSQIRVYLFQELCRQPQVLVRDLYSFIGVDPTFEPDLSRRVNKSGVPKSRLLQTTLATLQSFGSVVRPILPESLVDAVLSLRNANLEKPALKSSTQARLIEMYRDDVRSLEELLDRDLSHWLQED